ncbi:MAG: esterase/lipase family protein [Bryobacteraceae bacterium]
MGFSFNAPTVLDQIAKAINDYRANKNATATQADVIAHSMGGLVTLTAVEQSNFVSRMAYGKGRIERLITIGTPYLGSPVATQALQGNSCVTDKLALAGKYAILSANTNPPQGGIGDLQGCPNGSLTGCVNALGGQVTDPTGGPVPSQSIQALHPQSYNGVQVPAAYVGAYETAVNTGALQLSPVASGFRTSCGNASLAQNLTATLWKQNIFGGLDSDGVVSIISQMNGASTSPPNFVAPNDIHSEGLEALGFLGLTEQQDPNIASQVFQLLNMPTSQFTLIPSSGGG